MNGVPLDLTARIVAAVRDLHMCHASGPDPKQPGAPAAPVPETPHLPDAEPKRYPIHPEIPMQPIHEPVQEPPEPEYTPVEGP